MQKKTSPELTRSEPEAPPESAPPSAECVPTIAELEAEIRTMRNELKASGRATFTGPADKRWTKINAELAALREAAKTGNAAPQAAAAG